MHSEDEWGLAGSTCSRQRVELYSRAAEGGKAMHMRPAAIQRVGEWCWKYKARRRRG